MDGLWESLNENSFQYIFAKYLDASICVIPKSFGIFFKPAFRNLRKAHHFSVRLCKNVTRGVCLEQISYSFAVKSDLTLLLQIIGRRSYCNAVFDTEDGWAL